MESPNSNVTGVVHPFDPNAALKWIMGAFSKGKPCVIIMNGVQGSGKSSFVAYLINALQQTGHTARCASADFYFMRTGEYVFSQRQLPEAHESCKVKFRQAVKDKVDCIFVDNTNTNYDHQKYYEGAEDYEILKLSLSVGDIPQKIAALICGFRNAHDVKVPFVHSHLDTQAKTWSKIKDGYDHMQMQMFVTPRELANAQAIAKTLPEIQHLDIEQIDSKILHCDVYMPHPNLAKAGGTVMHKWITATRKSLEEKYPGLEEPGDHLGATLGFGIKAQKIGQTLRKGDLKMSPTPQFFYMEKNWANPWDLHVETGPLYIHTDEFGAQVFFVDVDISLENGTDEELELFNGRGHVTVAVKGRPPYDSKKVKEMEIYAHIFKNE